MTIFKTSNKSKKRYVPSSILIEEDQVERVVGGGDWGSDCYDFRQKFHQILDGRISHCRVHDEQRRVGSKIRNQV